MKLKAIRIRRAVAIGCNCGKNRSTTISTPVQRVTVYQVMSVKDGSVLEEYSNLTEARAEATKVGGRVRVQSKVL